MGQNTRLKKKKKKEAEANFLPYFNIGVLDSSESKTRTSNNLIICNPKYNLVGWQSKYLIGTLLTCRSFFWLVLHYLYCFQSLETKKNIFYLYVKAKSKEYIYIYIYCWKLFKVWIKSLFEWFFFFFFGRIFGKLKWKHMRVITRDGTKIWT